MVNIMGYTAKLNAAIEGTNHSNKSIDELMTSLDMSNGAIRNNGGGFYNHCLFWKVMSPNGGGLPSGSLADAINRDFGSFENFKDAFSNAAATQLVLDGHGFVYLMVAN